MKPLFFLKQGLNNWNRLLEIKKYRLSLTEGILLMFIALHINLFLSRWTEQFKVLAVGDLILDHIPTYNLNFLYTTGIYLIILGIFIFPLIFKPEIAPFTLKTYSFFIIIRAMFISLTHIGPHPNIFIEQDTANTFFEKFFYQNDLFFSAHTGIPFLAFLIFYKENKTLSYFFLLGSFVMGATVLIMHKHYSIDVFSAYFITYSIYKVSNELFINLNNHFKKIVTAERKFVDRLKKEKNKIQSKLEKFTKCWLLIIKTMQNKD